MPKSKKTRQKEYRPERHHIGSYVMMLAPQDKALLVDIFQNVSCAVEFKLHRGMMTLDDTQMLRDYVNLGTALSITAHHIDHDFFEDETRAKWLRLQRAFHSFYQRAVRQGKFTCTAEELEGIREGCVVADELFRIEMEKEPAWVFSNLLYIKEVTNSPGCKTVQADPAVMEEAIRRISQRCHNAHFMRTRRY